MQFIHTVHVVKNVKQRVIISWDSLLAHYAVVDLRDGFFKVGSSTSVPLMRVTDAAPSSCDAVVLPAMS